MNWNVAIHDDAAKIGGGMVPYAVTMLMVTSSGPAWFRIISSVIAGMMSCAISYTLIRLILNKELGHKRLHMAELSFFMTRIVVHGWAAWRAYHGAAMQPIEMTGLSNLTESIFGLYFLSSRRDLEVTFERSEARRRANLENLKDIRQATSQILYAAQQLTPSVQPTGKELENAGVR